MVSLEHLSNKFNNPKAQILSETLDKAVAKYLDNGNSPSRKVGELDNRGTHFYLAMYWAEALSEQNKDKDMADKFKDVAKKLQDNKDVILKQIADAEGKPTDMGGYYLPEKAKVEKAMRPSEVLNTIINSI
jgi:isocitrate dehydrogenase